MLDIIKSVDLFQILQIIKVLLLCIIGATLLSLIGSLIVHYSVKIFERKEKNNY
jgi:hypothetical protein